MFKLQHAVYNEVNNEIIKQQNTTMQNACILKIQRQLIWPKYSKLADFNVPLYIENANTI